MGLSIAIFRLLKNDNIVASCQNFALARSLLIHKLHDTFCCYTFYSNEKQTILPVMCFHILFPLIWNHLYQLYIQRNFSFYVYCNVYNNHLFFILLFFLLFSFSPLFFCDTITISNQPTRQKAANIYQSS